MRALISRAWRPPACGSVRRRGTCWTRPSGALRPRTPTSSGARTGQAALTAAGEQDASSASTKFAWSDTGSPSVSPATSATRTLWATVVERGRKVCGRDDLVARSSSAICTARSRDQIVEDPIPWPPTGSASSCRADGGRSRGRSGSRARRAGRSAPPARSWDRDAPRLAAGNRASFVNDHLEAALGELVGGAQAGDAPTQDDDLHGNALSPQSRTGSFPLPGGARSGAPWQSSARETATRRRLARAV